MLFLSYPESQSASKYRKKAETSVSRARAAIGVLREKDDCSPTTTSIAQTSTTGGVLHEKDGAAPPNGSVPPCYGSQAFSRYSVKSTSCTGFIFSSVKPLLPMCELRIFSRYV